MNKPLLIYCYDAYCGWCFGFSNVIKKIASDFTHQLEMEVLSGGMIITEKPVHIKASAGFIHKTYKSIESLTGVTFGQDYLWHIFNSEESDWYPHSEKPAIALCILKEYYPTRAVEFAIDLQYALHVEGRDLTDNEAYRHLLEKYGIHPEVFYQKLADESYKEQAHYEFSLVKQLKVDGYPCVFIQTGETSFHMVARGYTDAETLTNRIKKVLKTLSVNQNPE